MSEHATKLPYDAGLKALDLWLGRFCSCVLTATAFYGSAKLPHYVAALLFALACVAVYATFTGLVKLAQAMGVVGADVLKSASPTSFEDDGLIAPRPVAPISVAADATRAKGAAVLVSGLRKSYDLHTVNIAGRGPVTYRLADRR